MPAKLAEPPVNKKPELYSKDVLRLAASLPHDDKLPIPGEIASRMSPVCGSEITVELTIAESGQIESLAFRARACALGQASAALLRKSGIGRTAAEIAAMRDTLAAALAGAQEFDTCWPELAVFEAAHAFPARHSAILLPYDALLAALGEEN